MGWQSKPFIDTFVVDLLMTDVDVVKGIINDIMCTLFSVKCMPMYKGGQSGMPIGELGWNLGCASFFCEL